MASVGPSAVRGLRRSDCPNPCVPASVLDNVCVDAGYGHDQRCLSPGRGLDMTGLSKPLSKPPAVQEMTVCPCCHGAGSIPELALHDHEWRLGSTLGMRYFCVVDGCDAVICAGCREEGLERCPSKWERLGARVDEETKALNARGAKRKF